MKRIQTKVITALALLTFLSAISSAYATDVLWSLKGFDQPESAIFDTARGQVIVSNINGGFDELNGAGYLSLLTADGEIINRKWVVGMNAPKGMAIVGNNLFVSDLTRVHKIDISAGVIIETYDAEGAIFLNDLTAAIDEKIYVSDLMGNAIYVLEEEKLNLWLKSDQLAHPNGVYANDGMLYVGTWGTGMHEDFSTDVPGSLIKIDLKSKSISSLKGGDKIGNLDGVTRIADHWIFNDWVSGKMYSLNNMSELKEIGSYRAGLADIDAMGDKILMPYMLDGTIETISYSAN